MNSRKMERADVKVPGSEPRIDGSEVARTLRGLLKRPHLGAPKRLLILDWSLEDGPLEDGLLEDGPLEDGGTSLAEEVVSSPLAEILEVAEVKTYDAVLWSTSPHGPDAEELRRVGQLLGEAGRLVIHTPEGRGLSPDAIGRLLVRELSETGFVILKELSPENLGAESGAVVLARRDDYVIQNYREGDDEAISQLFVDSFHVERGDPHWQWKYHQSPYGNRYMSLAFSADGELASHYAGFPVPFWCDGRPFLGLQMGDTMTGPRFRSVGRGVSSLLARAVRHFFARYRRGPFGFFYGFNTGPIQRFCEWFIGGSQVEPVRYLVRPGGEPPPQVRGYRAQRVTSVSEGLVGEDWDRFFKRVAPRYGFLVRRDAEYVDWRYLRCPDGEPYVVLAARRWGQLVGWGVFRRKEDRLLWGDALLDPRHARAAGAILAAALETDELKTDKGEDARQVEGWFSDRPDWLRDEFERLGFVQHPQPDKLGFMILPDTEKEPPLGRLYYTMGDGDLF